MAENLSFTTDPTRFISLDLCIGAVTWPELLSLLRRAYDKAHPACDILVRFLDFEKMERHFKNQSQAAPLSVIWYEAFGSRTMVPYSLDDIRRALKLSGFLLDINVDNDHDMFLSTSFDSLTTTVKVSKEDHRTRTKLPKVSFCIPAYKPNYFEETLQSVCNQSYPNAEIIITDDDESGRIEKIVKNFKASSPFEIRYFKNPQRLGGLLNCTKVVKLATGEYIKYIYDDDLYEPDLTRELVWHMEGFGSDVSLAVCARDLISQTGKPLPDNPTVVPVTKCNSLLLGKELIDSIMTTTVNTLGEPMAALFRKADLDDLDSFFIAEGEDYVGNLDLVLFIRLLSKGNCIYLPKRMVHFRQHPSQETLSDEAKFQIHYAWYPMLRFARDKGFLQNPSHYKQAIMKVCELLYYFLINNANKLNSEQLAQIESAIGWMCEQAKKINADPSVAFYSQQPVYTDFYST